MQLSGPQPVDGLVAALRTEIMLAEVLSWHRQIMVFVARANGFEFVKANLSGVPGAIWNRERNYEPWVDIARTHDNREFLVKIRLGGSGFDLPVDLQPDPQGALSGNIVHLLICKRGSRITMGGSPDAPAHFAVDTAIQDSARPQTQSWRTRLSNMVHWISGGLLGSEAPLAPKSGIKVGRDNNRGSATQQTVEYLSIIRDAIKDLHTALQNADKPS